MARNTAGGEYDREPKEPSLSCIWSQHNPFRHLRCGVVLVLKRVVFLHGPLYSCTTLEMYVTSSFVFYLANCAFVNTDKLSDMRKKVSFLNSRIASLYGTSARSGRVVPENLRI